MTFRYYLDQLVKMEPAKRQQLESCASVRTEKWIDVPSECVEERVSQHAAATAAAPVQPAAHVTAPAPQQSRGLGDTIKMIADATGMSYLAKVYERATGQPCGCEERRKKLNELLPYT